MTLRLLSGTFRAFQLWKLKHDKLLSNGAFNCKVRHYTASIVETRGPGFAMPAASGFRLLPPGDEHEPTVWRGVWGVAHVHSCAHIRTRATE